MAVRVLCSRLEGTQAQFARQLCLWVSKSRAELAAGTTRRPSTAEGGHTFASGPCNSGAATPRACVPAARKCAGTATVLGNCRSARRQCSSAAAASSASTATPSSASIDAKEVDKFSALSAQWWSPRGPFAALHALNPARVAFLRAAAVRHWARPADTPAPLAGLTAADIGCGGGILTESLARLGADVTAVDASPDNIGVACAHAARSPALSPRLRYACTSAEALAEQGATFDLVVASEVIEHVRKPAAFVSTLAALRGAGGAVALTTLNRTPESYALAIVAAERVLGLAPAGAHDWNKFVTPDELQLAFESTGLQMQLLAGMQMAVLSGRWRCSDDARVNYCAFFAEPPP